MGAGARLLWALLSALLMGGWLLAARDGRANRLFLSNALRAVTLAYGALWALIWLGLALARLSYPFELEWSGGEVLDHCRQALTGHSLYVPPGSGWFPYEYPPLYFWTAALLMRLTGFTYAALRIVSLLSTLGCCVIISLWTRLLIRGRGDGLQMTRGEMASREREEVRHGVVWGGIAAGLFLASYRLTGAWFDIERIDMLFLFLSLLGVLRLEHRDYPGAALAFSLAFFTKQQAILFIFGGIAALACRKHWRETTLFSGLSLLFCLVPGLLLNRATQGWFYYYCFHVPAANGIKVSLALKFLLQDLPLYTPAIALILASKFRAPKSSVHDQDVLFAMTLMGLLGSLLSRAHWGGDQNVLIAGYLFVGTAACVTAGRWERLQPQRSAPLYALALAQMLTLFYRPDAQRPTQAGREAGQRYQQRVQELEQEGEVLCLDHGGFTAIPHFQLMGLLDLMNTEKRLPSALVNAIHTHRYAAIVTDALPAPQSLLGQELQGNYRPMECLHLTQSWIVTGYPTPSPSRPVYLLRPVK